MKSDGGLRLLFRRHLKQVHWTTIESRSTESGIPDLTGCWNGREFWIECKRAHGWKAIMRAAQIVWINRHIRMGGKVFIAVRRKTRKDDELWIITGEAAPLLGAGLPALPQWAILGHWSKGPAHWGWLAILRAVRRPWHPGQAVKAAPGP